MVTVRELRAVGHDATHLGEQGLMRMPDPEILEKAASEARIVLTFDLDFGELLASSAASLPSVIIFRLHDETPASVNPRLLKAVVEHEKALRAGAVVVVEDGRSRARSLPLKRRHSRSL
jgi:predicted nuclease of predicted toxin-antitoxin system